MHTSRSLTALPPETARATSESILAFVGVLGRIGRELRIALSAGDLGFRFNLTLEVSTPRARPFVTGCNQLNGFL
jgi:hypothetical protein